MVTWFQLPSTNSYDHGLFGLDRGIDIQSISHRVMEGQGISIGFGRCRKVKHQVILHCECHLNEVMYSTNTLLWQLYHEATLINLLEVIFYKKEVALSGGDLLDDLVDYCHRKILFLNTWYAPPALPLIPCMHEQTHSYGF
jgi:hypothetical protein